MFHAEPAATTTSPMAANTVDDVIRGDAENITFFEIIYLLFNKIYYNKAESLHKNK